MTLPENAGLRPLVGTRLGPNSARILRRSFRVHLLRARSLGLARTWQRSFSRLAQGDRSTPPVAKVTTWWRGRCGRGEQDLCCRVRRRFVARHGQGATRTKHLPCTDGNRVSAFRIAIGVGAWILNGTGVDD